MTASDIIQELNRRGVELKVEGERLRFRPKHAVTPDLLATMREHKAEIVSTLTAPAVRARVRGWEETVETAACEVCWHCKGEKSCRCALCAVARPGTSWGKGSCRACSGTGHLAWPSTIQ